MFINIYLACLKHRNWIDVLGQLIKRRDFEQAVSDNIHYKTPQMLLDYLAINTHQLETYLSR